MRDLLTAIPGIVARPRALAENPLLGALVWTPPGRRDGTLATRAALALVGLNTALPILLHLLHVPITAHSLSAAHAGLALLLLAAYRVLKREWHAPAWASWRIPAALALTFAVMVLPWTHLTGIDTYKWQDLATSLRVEQRIAWLVHPLSLLGFTDRSYPSAYPLLSGSAQLLGGLSVDWGFAVMSAVCGAMGAVGAFLFGRRVFHERWAAGWLAFLYVFSPVFARYGHWATGRGLFLAVLPFYMVLLLSARSWRCVPEIALCGLLLALCHKAGLVAALALPVLMMCACVAPRQPGRLLPSALALASLAACVILAFHASHGSPAATALRLARLGLGRLGWISGGACLGFLVSAPCFARREWRMLVPGGLVLAPLLFADDMYGCMLLLPFACCAAVVFIEHTAARTARRKTLAALVVALTLAGGLAVVVYRAQQAVSPALFRAAQFLEARDPRGPCRVEGPTRVGSRVQAYLSGCPRFEVRQSGPIRLSLKPLPLNPRDPADFLRAWTRYLRSPFAVSGCSTLWYGGEHVTTYFIVVDGEGARPVNGQPLYDREGIQILAVEAQP